MTVRFLIVSCLLLASAAGVLAKGEYQSTKNGRTMVWNSDPKPGDVATWNGDRDDEGYATGFGTLTWYKTRGDSKPNVYGVYYGNMVRGKFEGPVNLHLKRKTAHAVFIGGTRTSPWARGRAPTWNAGPRSVARETETVTPRKPKADDPPTAVAAKKAAPVEANFLNEPEPAEPVRTAVAKPAPPAPAGEQEDSMPRVATTPEPEPPAQKPVSSPPPARRPDPPKPPESAATPKTKFDDSLRALVGPPSSLRASPTPEAPAEGGEATPSTSPGRSSSAEAKPASAPASAELTETEVINLAYVEALSHGYNLGNYEAPKVDYSKAKDRWSVFYDAKAADTAEGIAKSLIIVVEDKTKKAFVNPR